VRRLCRRSARASTHAANTPAKAPNRCACHEIPRAPGRTPHNIPPQSSNNTAATASCAILRLNTPRTSRNANHPKARPDAPIVTVSLGAVSHTPKPPNPHTIPVTANHLAKPVAVTRNANTRMGIVFPTRWSQPLSNSGDQTMPSSPPRLRGSIPASSRSAGRIPSTISTSNSKTVNAPASMAAAAGCRGRTRLLSDSCEPVKDDFGDVTPSTVRWSDRAPPTGNATGGLRGSGPELPVEFLRGLVQRAAVGARGKILPSRVGDHESDIGAFPAPTGTLGHRQRGVQHGPGRDTGEDSLVLQQLPGPPESVVGPYREPTVEHALVVQFGDEPLVDVAQPVN